MAVTRPPGAGLTENHRRALTAGFGHIAELLDKIERTVAEEPGPFTRHLQDLTPSQRRLASASVTALRARLADAFKALDMPLPPPTAPASAAVRTYLDFAAIALEDMSPERLRGYGALGADTAALLRLVETDLGVVLRRCRAMLAEGSDLAARVSGIADAPDLARFLAEVIERHGLVDLRPALLALLDLLARRSFEIAVFGRVSAGKSSLLNAILGAAVLPVGVTPVTMAVTRVAWGANEAIEVERAGAPPERVPLDRLADYVAEERNPRNRLQVIA